MNCIRPLPTLSAFFLCFFYFPILSQAQTNPAAGMASPSENRYAIIPYPSFLIPREGVFVIDPGTALEIAPEAARLFRNEAGVLQQMIGKRAGGRALKPGSQSHAIFLQYDSSIHADEGYALSIDPGKVVLKARTAAGMFYAVQTFRQLLPAGVEDGTGGGIGVAKTLSVPAVEIIDQPAYSWRGLMLDVSRHFFSVDYLKRFIDHMALYKYNTFHLHLTDDQGWRIEIKKYPRLTTEGAWRTFNNQDSIDIESYKETGNPDLRMDSAHLRWRDGKTEHGGFYTQEQMKEVIRYAASRHIEIIPEIDMPGHMMAAIRLYPWLSCEGHSRADGSWAFSTPVCVSNDSVLQFVKDVLSEVIALFPSKYIHIGGDEVDKRGWENSASSRAFMAQHGIRTFEQLQSYFNDQLLEFFHAHGKTLLGWDEIVEGGIDRSAAVMFWRPGSKTLTQATQNGNKVIMTPDGPFYFDAAPDGNTLKTVYNYNMNDTSYRMSEAQQKNIIGVQGNLWTEWITTESRADYMLMPRMTALAELGWTHRDLYDSYLKRLVQHYDRLDKLGIHYYMPSIPGLEESHVFTDTTSFFTSSPFPGLAIHYTLDGTVPMSSSPVLSRPLGIDHSLTMRLASFSPGGNRSAMNIVSFDRQSYAEAVTLPNQKPGLECRLYWGDFPRTTKIKANADSVLQVGEAVVPAGIPDTGFGLKFKGYIEVPETGVYRFFLTCDDGGVLNIADRLIVDNDGDHGPREKSGEVALKKGVHPFALNFTNLSYGYTLSLKYSKDNGPRQNIPASWYKSGL